MKKKQSIKSIFVNLFIYLVLFLLVTAILVLDICSRCSRGWVNNDTIQIVFAACAFATGIYMSKTFIDYFVSKSKDVVYLNNDIYRVFTKLENNKKIKKFEETIVSKEIDSYLAKMNTILAKKTKDYVIVSLDNINDYFDEKYEIYIGEDGVRLITSIKLASLYKKIKRHKSIKYERLYSSVHSGDLIKEKKFPLFELILPLLFGVIGVFVTIYQSLSADSLINESVLEYLKLFGATFIFSFCLAVFNIRPFKEGVVSEKIRLLETLESFDDKNIE